jgi:hypothetical protein
LLDGVGSNKLHPGVDEALSIDCNAQFDVRSDTYFDAIVLQRLETDEEHLAAIAAFQQVFGRRPLLATRPSLRKSISGDCMRVGQIVLQCKGSVKELQANSAAVVLPSRIRHLEALALAVSSAWPAIVSSGDYLGSDAGDARSLVESLAALCGRRLTELRIGPGTDSSDLLGGFAQCDALREVRFAISKGHEALERALTELLFGMNNVCECLFESIYRVETLRTRLVETSSVYLKCPKDFQAPDLRNLVETIYRVLNDISLVPCFTEHESALGKSLNHLLESAGCAAKKAEAFLVLRAGSFEWRQSAMVDALERGDWILLPNADQCPAAILDRLNPLLERPAVKLCSDSDRLALRKNCGSLLVAEAPPLADGSPVVVRPHPDSRVFMTVVRGQGSRVRDGLSKAVRNRALEICLRGVPDYADRFAELMDFGASLNGTLQFLEWAKEYRSSSQPIAALTDRLAYRLCDVARSVYAHSTNHAVSQSDKSGTSRIREGVDQELFKLGSSMTAIIPTDSLEPRSAVTHTRSRNDVYADAFISSMRGNASNLHRMVICSSDCNLGRDLNTLVMFCVASHLNLACLGSSFEWCDCLNVSEMTKNAICDLDIDFQDVHARLVYYMAEACIIASMSHCDKGNRLSLLSRMGHYQLESDEYGIVLNCAVANAAAADNIIERTSNMSLRVQSLREHACAPIDPLYSMDLESLLVLENSCDENELTLARTQALLDHFWRHGIEQSVKF